MTNEELEELKDELLPEGILAKVIVALLETRKEVTALKALANDEGK